MKELLKVSLNSEGKQIVSARDLHKFLEVEERFSRFMDRNLEYGFENGIDYTPYRLVHPQNLQDLEDFALTLSCAKEIAMIQRTEKGKQARQYFIECERKLIEVKQPTLLEQTRNLLIALEQNEALLLEKSTLESKIEQDKPKVVFADSVIGSSNSILIRQFAKDLCDENFEIGQNRLFEWFRENKYLNDNNEPYQEYVSQGYFEVITRAIGSGTDTFTSKTTKLTGKGQVYFAKKIKG